jgi:hypothetical protein
VLFVDIDGVLNPYAGACPPGFVEHWLFPEDDEPVRVCSAHGAWLHELAALYDLEWGSSWSVADRTTLGRVLDLPVFTGAVELPSGQFDPELKVPAVHDRAGDRACAWIDDLLGPGAFAWAASRVAPTLLIPADPAVGMTRTHVDELLAWPRELGNA